MPHTKSSLGGKLMADSRVWLSQHIRNLLLFLPRKVPKCKHYWFVRSRMSEMGQSVERCVGGLRSSKTLLRERISILGR